MGEFDLSSGDPDCCHGRAAKTTLLIRTITIDAESGDVPANRSLPSEYLESPSDRGRHWVVSPKPRHKIPL
jgi:hypothetical protein